MKAKKLCIIGAGGHGKVIADIALKNGYTDIVFADDSARDSCMDFPIVCTSEGLEALNDGSTDFTIAVGNNAMRKRIADTHDLNWVTLVHPSAQIGVNVKLGVGTVVMARAVINPSSTIGKHCIINTSSIIEHDNVIGDFAHISPGAALGGTVYVGNETHVGIGATVKNNVKICQDCVIGAGAVVVQDLNESATYVGVPAKRLIKNK